MHLLDKIFNNIFVINKSFEISAGDFNHCSSVASHKHGYILAWYAGTRECADDQSVHLAYVHKNRTSKFFRLGDCTGNPVVWNNGNECILLWSRFEEADLVRRPVDRWKHCSLWAQRCAYDSKSDTVKLVGQKDQIAVPQWHLLGRCPPLEGKNGWLLPLYDEMNGNGVIMNYRSPGIERLGNIGNSMIQPAIWRDKNKLCSLSRNFRTTRKLSQYSESTDGGQTWSPPRNSLLFNKNNSLTVLHWHNMNCVVWNDTKGLKRDNLCFGKIIYDNGMIAGTPLFSLDSTYGSYPSMCVDSLGNMVVSYTNPHRNIQLVYWNTKYYDQHYPADQWPRRRDTVGQT